jgi:hypothetical protein
MPSTDVLVVATCPCCRDIVTPIALTLPRRRRIVVWRCPLNCLKTPTETGPLEIHEVPVDMTVIDGRVVFERNRRQKFFVSSD